MLLQCSLILSFLYSFSVQVVIAQRQDLVDSLLHLTTTNPGDSLAFEIHRKLGYYHPDPLEALAHSQKALELATLSENRLNMARALERIGTAQEVLGNKTESYQATYEALAIYDSLGLKNREAGMTLQIASKLTGDKRYDEAITYFKKSLKLFIEMEDRSNQAITLVNFGEALRLANRLDGAISKFNQALEINKTVNNLTIQAYALGNMGMANHALGKLQKAKKELKSSVDLLKELADPVSVVIYEAEIGQIDLKMGQKQAGLRRIEAAFDSAKRRHIKQQIRDLSSVLARICAKNGQYDKAYFYQNEFQAYHDSLVNEEIIRKTEQIKSQYALDKKNNEIDNLKLKNELAAINLKRKEAQLTFNLILLLLLVVLTVLIYQAYRNKKRRALDLFKKNQIIAKQSEERSLLHQEMHHRVKNNLQLIASIMGLQVQSTKDGQVSSEIASNKLRVEAMTLIHQHLYIPEQLTQLDIKDYIERLGNNLKATYREEINQLKVNVTKMRVMPDESIPIGLIINESVCNSVKYCQGTLLDIQIEFVSGEGQYLLSISDNGPGFSTAHEGETGFGTKLITILSRQLGATLDIASSTLGTIVTLVIPGFREISRSATQVHPSKVLS
ncbi:tetratricopeptide repeat protein [Fulvivirga sp. M361]|uniref:tetratricopeptide repeat-containing sensor histidine kinase n=1 Tax=Fulvivirga sp. M361 TaxID=2594266 RepID=UPI00117AD6C6|nr:histidine kinase dimerization/phosphoacceptor domain -containing protein [Fulvivirga sp. M361]TRX48393.1 tetratricopeptide repeat protein [Fulvivirga sp. M361]